MKQIYLNYNTSVPLDPSTSGKKLSVLTAARPPARHATSDPPITWHYTGHLSHPRSDGANKQKVT